MVLVFPRVIMSVLTIYKVHIQATFLNKEYMMHDSDPLSIIPNHCSHKIRFFWWKLPKFYKMFCKLRLDDAEENIKELETLCMTKKTLLNNLVPMSHFYPRPVLVFRYCRCLRLCVSVCLCVYLCVNHEFVRAITLHPFKLESPNLEHRCKTPWLGSLLYCGVIDLDLQGQI